MMITIHHVEIVKNNTCILFLYLRYLIFNLNHIHIHVYTCMHAHTHTHTHKEHSFMDVLPTDGINL